MTKPPFSFRWEINIPTIAFLIAQLVGGVWYVASLDAKVDTNSDNIAKNTVELKQLEFKQQAADTVAARLDQRTLAIENTLTRIERLIEGLYNERRGPRP